jgi:F0F1-type ATP synthase assembly protein I
VRVPEQPIPERDIRFYYTLAQTGIEMVIPIGIGALLDYSFGWTPWATLAGAVIGPVVGITHMVRLVNAHEAQKSPPSKGPG